MKIFFNVILAILVFLAVSSGVTKIMLMEQDVQFFAPYGFTNPILVAFGAIQLAGGMLLILKKTRVAGALVVSMTFLISAVVLFMAQNFALTVATIISLLLLGLTIRNSLKQGVQDKKLDANKSA